MQTTSNGQTLVTVQQTAQRAVTTWESFNVGQTTTVNFDQSGGNTSTGNNWVMLTRIDATGAPSQIQGQIKADGTVLIINPNGIIFNGTSQINVHSLIASTQDINGAFTAVNGRSGYVMAPGTLNFLVPSNEDAANVAFVDNGLFGQSTINTVSVSTASFAQGANTSSNRGIIVDAGAALTTNVDGFDSGGFDALLGPSVSNAGGITASSGQIILAAGASTSLIEPLSGSTQTAFTVGAGGTGSALVSNTGLLISNDGNITLAGDSVVQSGIAEATTSVNRPGSQTFQATGTVTFGPGSLTTILPDTTGGTIPEGSESSFVAPTIDVSTLNMDAQPNSLILAPGASMNISSADLATQSTSSPAGRILFEQGSEIDLAGLAGVQVPVSDTLFTFRVTSNDVADTPLAQNLIGQLVTIDLSQSGTRSDGETWVGSPLFAATGAGDLANLPLTIDQLLTKGGSLNISPSAFPEIGNAQTPVAVQDVVQAPGAIINVSGGFTQFTGAKVATTELVTANGEIVNIANADPFISYAGIAGQFVVDHPHWGPTVTETFGAPLISASASHFEPGFIAGASAGNIALSAVNPVLEGTLVANIIIGPNQALAATPATGGTQTINQLPSGASLTLNLGTYTLHGDRHDRAGRQRAGCPRRESDADLGDQSAIVVGGLFQQSHADAFRFGPVGDRFRFDRHQRRGRSVDEPGREPDGPGRRQHQPRQYHDDRRHAQCARRKRRADRLQADGDRRRPDPARARHCHRSRCLDQCARPLRQRQ